jgi:hypothetical protein
VVAGGWSLGGYAAITLLSGDDSVCDTMFGVDVTDPPDWTCAATPPDPRVEALVLFDASSWALHFDELQRVEVPALAMGETWDRLLGVLGPSMASWQARQHAGLSGRPNYRVDVKASIHQSFSDMCEHARAMKLKDAPPAWMGPWDDVLSAYCGPDVIPSPTAHRLMTSYSIAFLKTTVEDERGYSHILTPRYAVAHEPKVEFFRRERCKPPVPTPDWPPDWVYYQHMPPLDDDGDEQCP